ncbi:MAG: DUF4974 domain-containing protein [Bacteroidaceae bacterium]|nr:DUF4974 domain-containing protein [Bacteroidaceae bacterium]
MKTTFEEIDRRIDMPDIDAEWARFEREVIRSTSDGPSAPPRRFRLPRAAAIAALAIGISLTAWASIWIVRVVIPARRAAAISAGDAKHRDTLTTLTNPPADTLAMFVFENVDMLTIARTLGEHYGVEPVFRDEALTHVRLYARIEKNKSLNEVVALLNHFKKVRLTVTDGKLIIDSRNEKD